MALLYAGDRAEAAPQIRQWLAEGKAVVLERYVYSNVGYQCAKLPAGAARDALRRWILDLEFGHNRLPRPDLSLFLDVPFSFTERKLAEAREGRTEAICRGRAISTRMPSTCSAACARSTSMRQPRTRSCGSSTAATIPEPWPLRRRFLTK